MGGTLVFIGRDSQLYLRDINQRQPRALGPVDELAHTPILSPDGQWVAFVGGRELKKLNVVGGATSSIATLDVLPRLGFWSDDDMIYSGSAQGIFAVPATRGAAEAVTTLRENELGHNSPFVVRQGLLFQVNAVEQRVAVLPSGEKEHRYLTQGGSPWVSPTGHLLFRRGAVLWAAPFDEDSLQLTGDEIPVLEPVGQFGLSNDGTLLYNRGNGADGSELVWVDRRGEIAPTTTHKDFFFYPRLFPDGRRVVVNAGNDGGTIWSLDLERGTRFLIAGGGANHPVLSPNDDRLAYQSSQFDVLGSSYNGGESTELLSTPAQETPHHWTPDGRFLAATATSSQDKDILLIGDDGEVLPFLDSESNETAPRFSPDGRWLAYASDETGQWEIYVTDFPDSRRRYPISASGGREPLFSHDSRELFYRQGRRMMAVSIGMGPTLDAGRPVVLFEGDFRQAAASGSANYDVSFDGERFLMVRGDPRAADLSDINVVLNWTQELERLVPVNK